MGGSQSLRELGSRMAVGVGGNQKSTNSRGMGLRMMGEDEACCCSSSCHKVCLWVEEDEVCCCSSSCHKACL